MLPCEKRIDRISHPGGIRDRRNLWTNRGAKGPMVRRVGLGHLVRRCWGVLDDPCLKRFNLIGFERLTVWRHPLRWVVIRHTRQQSTLGVTWRDRRTRITPSDRHRDGIQPQSALLFERAMTRIAPVPQQWFDLLDVVALLIRGCRSEEEEQEEIGREEVT